MAEPGFRKSRVRLVTPKSSQRYHDQLRPQGGRGIRTSEQGSGARRRASGEGDGGVRPLPEQRSGSGGPFPFQQSAAYSGGEACANGRLHRAGQGTGRRERQKAALVPRTVVGVVLCSCLWLAACGRHQQARVKVPPPPATAKSAPKAPAEPSAQPAPPPTAPETEKESKEAPEQIPVPENAKPIYVETGKASWYGAPYHNRRGSNGEIYNMHAMTAAHRTLPLGSVVRVTNLKTGRSAVVRITDRGPFIKGRMLDLSLAAAKAVDVWGPGLAKVHMEVLQTPASLDSGGRWAVQIGACEGEKAANDVADHLSHRSHTAKVLRFSSVIGSWWVRVRVQDDDRHRAEEIAHDTHTPEGSLFLIRLD